jgi:hypothetical protein
VSHPPYLLPDGPRRAARQHHPLNDLGHDDVAAGAGANPERDGNAGAGGEGGLVELIAQRAATLRAALVALRIKQDEPE